MLLFLEQLAVNPVFSEPKGSMFHLRLLDRLDRPEDGYCIDILGTPGNLRVELPLFAHNCKTTLTTDSAVIFTSDGLIKFPSVDLCVTVAGVNSNALPGASTLLRKCNDSTPESLPTLFYHAQSFTANTSLSKCPPLWQSADCRCDTAWAGGQADRVVWSSGSAKSTPPPEQGTR